MTSNDWNTNVQKSVCTNLNTDTDGMYLNKQLWIPLYKHPHKHSYKRLNLVQVIVGIVVLVLVRIDDYTRTLIMCDNNL